MEHNTLVKYGFLQADILCVPDLEGETAENFPQGNHTISVMMMMVMMMATLFQRK